MMKIEPNKTKINQAKRKKKEKLEVIKKKEITIISIGRKQG